MAPKLRGAAADLHATGASIVAGRDYQDRGIFTPDRSRSIDVVHGSVGNCPEELARSCVCAHYFLRHEADDLVALLSADQNWGRISIVHVPFRPQDRPVTLTKRHQRTAGTADRNDHGVLVCERARRITALQKSAFVVSPQIIGPKTLSGAP